MAGNIESARDLGQGVYTQPEVDAKESGLQALSRGFKNYIINGGFDVWQRGTSFDNVSNVIYTADRWISNNSGEWNVEKDNGYKITAVSSPAFFYLNTRIENPYKLSNKTVTLSFNIKCQNGSRDIWVRHRRSGETSSTIEEITINSVDARYSATFTALSMDSLTNADDYYQIEILIGDSNVVNAGDEYTVYNVQLEEGSVATPFEQRPYGLELSLCQRYYTVQQGRGIQNAKYNSTDIVAGLSFHSKMRAAPSITPLSISEAGSVTQLSATSYDINSTGLTNIRLSNSLPNDKGAADFIIAFDAEL